VTDSSVSAKCSNCCNLLPADRNSCLICGSTKRDLSVVLNDTVHIKARIKHIAVRSQITKKYFIPGAILTLASAFTGLMTNSLGLGIGIGLALAAASLILGLRASTKIIDRDSSDA
jgi:recombinational DNA repair protein RecR